MPASAVPNSLISSVQAALERLAQRVLDEVGLHRLRDRLAGMSASGSSASSSSGAPAGSQEMKYSAISDCGSDEQVGLVAERAELAGELDRDHARACPR